MSTFNRANNEQYSAWLRIDHSSTRMTMCLRDFLNRQNKALNIPHLPQDSEVLPSWLGYGMYSFKRTHMSTYLPFIEGDNVFMVQHLLPSMSKSFDGFRHLVEQELTWINDQRVYFPQHGRLVQHSILGFIIDMQQCLPMSLCTGQWMQEVTSSNLRDEITKRHNLWEVCGIKRGLWSLLDIQCTFDNDFCCKRDDKMPDIDRRSDWTNTAGLLCQGFTPHSQDAGKLRRLAHNARVQFIGAKQVGMIMGLLEVAMQYQTDTDDSWTLVVCGHYTRCSHGAVQAMVNMHYTLQLLDYSFPMLYTFDDHMLCLVLPIQGNVVCRSRSYQYADRMQMYTSLRPSLRYSLLPMDNLCYFYHMVPYCWNDRQPRGSMAALYCQQASCLPMTMHGVQMSQLSAWKTLCATPLGTWTLTNENGIYPGFEVTILFCNAPLNYEDCIIVSQAAVDRGMFQSEVVSQYKHTPKAGSTIPKLGDKVTRDNTTWYRGTSSGEITEVKVTVSGTLAIKVKRINNLQTGDKLATQHGQKGVSYVVPRSDMLYGLDSVSGQMIEFDVVMSCTSIVNRVTIGQIEECSHSITTVTGYSSPDDKVCQPGMPNKVPMPTCTVINGITGEPIPTMADHARDIVCSYGVCRMWNLTHMSQDKQHYESHPQAYTIEPKSGKSTGGSVRLSEQAHIALGSLGLINTLNELRSRQGIVAVNVCQQCSRVESACLCDQSSTMRTMRMPSSTFKFDQMSRAVTGVGLLFQPDITESQLLQDVASLDPSRQMPCHPVNQGHQYVALMQGQSHWSTLNPPQNAYHQAK